MARREPSVYQISVRITTEKRDLWLGRKFYAVLQLKPVIDAITAVRSTSAAGH